MGFHATAEPDAYRQAREQDRVALADPAVKARSPHPLDREQPPWRHEFAGPERRLGMLVEVRHPVIDSAKQIDDKVFMGHGGNSVGNNVFSPILTTIASVYGPTKWSQHHWLLKPLGLTLNIEIHSSILGYGYL